MRLKLAIAAMLSIGLVVVLWALIGGGPGQAQETAVEEATVEEATAEYDIDFPVDADYTLQFHYYKHMDVIFHL